MSTVNQNIKKIKQLYSGLGWPTVFIHIRFFTAPYVPLEKLVPKKGLIIDFGCGYGIFSNLLGLASVNRQVIGIELDKKKLEFADHQIPNVTFRCEDATESRLVDADCILLIHLLHHLNSHKEQERLVRVCYEKLRPGGKLIVCEIGQKPFWKYLVTQFADHILYPGDTIFYRSEKEWVSFFKNFGFLVEVVSMHQHKPFSHLTFCLTRQKI